MAFEKGNELGQGRPKGSLNRLTRESREILAEMVRGEVANIGRYMDQIKDPVKKLDALSKFLPYLLPRLGAGELMIETQQARLPFDYTQLSEQALKEVLHLINIDEDENQEQ